MIDQLSACHGEGQQGAQQGAHSRRPARRPRRAAPAPSCYHRPFQAIPALIPSYTSVQQAAMGRGGSAASEGGSALELLASARFAPFRDDAFDPASFASRSLTESHTTAQAQTEQLQQGVAALDGALRQLVLNHQDDLIAQTARLTEAESAVQVRRHRRCSSARASCWWRPCGPAHTQHCTLSGTLQSSLRAAHLVVGAQPADGGSACARRGGRAAPADCHAHAAAAQPAGAFCSVQLARMCLESFACTCSSRAGLARSATRLAGCGTSQSNRPQPLHRCRRSSRDCRPPSWRSSTSRPLYFPAK